jgi:hypothetical protein
MIDESLHRTKYLLNDVQNAESRCEELREQNEIIRNDYDQLLAVKINIRFFFL